MQFFDIYLNKSNLNPFEGGDSLAKNLRCLKIIVWIGIVLFILWFVLFSFAPSKILAAMGVSETEGFFLRLYGVFPLGWAILFLFALKDLEKNIAILNSGIIVSLLAAVSVILVHLGKQGMGVFQWGSVVLLVILAVLLYVFKPRATQ